MILYAVGTTVDNPESHLMRLYCVTSDLHESIQHALICGLRFKTDVWYQSERLGYIYVQEEDIESNKAVPIFVSLWDGDDAVEDPPYKFEYDGLMGKVGESWITHYQRERLAEMLQN